MSAAAEPVWADADPFDLPEWLGVDEITWTPDDGLHEGLVAGRLRSERDGTEATCDLLAADVAYPAPVMPEDLRVRVHQTWRHGEVLLVERDGRLTLAAPGIEPPADQVLEMLRRLAKAVGSRPERFAARLYLGRDHTACRRTP
jgi:hypothetical protein